MIVLELFSILTLSLVGFAINLAAIAGVIGRRIGIETVSRRAAYTATAAGFGITSFVFILLFPTGSWYIFFPGSWIAAMIAAHHRYGSDDILELDRLDGTVIIPALFYLATLWGTARNGRLIFLFAPAAAVMAAFGVAVMYREGVRWARN